MQSYFQPSLILHQNHSNQFTQQRHLSLACHYGLHWASCTSLSSGSAVISKRHTRWCMGTQISYKSSIPSPAISLSEFTPVSIGKDSLCSQEQVSSQMTRSSRKSSSLLLRKEDIAIGRNGKRLPPWQVVIRLSISKCLPCIQMLLKCLEIQTKNLSHKKKKSNSTVIPLTKLGVKALSLK